MSYSSPPFTVGNVLRRAGEVFVADLGRYLAMMLLAILPVAAIAVSVPLLARSTGDVRTLWPIVVGMYVVMLAAITIVLGATTHAVAGSMQGRPVRVGESLAVGLSRFLPLLGVVLIVGSGMTLGFFVFVVPGVLFGLAYFMALPIAVIERRGVLGSFSQAAELSRGYRGTLFGITVCYVLISIAGNIAMRSTLRPLAGFLKDALGPSSGLPLVLLSIAALGCAMVLLAYQYVLIAVSYQMLRSERTTDTDDKLAGVFA